MVEQARDGQIDAAVVVEVRGRDGMLITELDARLEVDRDGRRRIEGAITSAVREGKITSPHIDLVRASVAVEIGDRRNAAAIASRFAKRAVAIAEENHVALGA